MDDVISAVNTLIRSLKDSSYDTGRIEDCFHSFDELYDHRTFLFLALLKENDTSWFSMKHDDGSMFDGMFIAGMETKDGMITYHIEGKYLPLFKKYVKEIPSAPKWDGHTPDDVLARLVGLENLAEVTKIIGERYEK